MIEVDLGAAVASSPACWVSTDIQHRGFAQGRPESGAQSEMLLMVDGPRGSSFQRSLEISFPSRGFLRPESI
jgi:hypothetical protein